MSLSPWAEILCSGENLPSQTNTNAPEWHSPAGADLVLELPALFACASAEYFARAGVALFTRMGCVDYLCFGAENADLSQLNKIAGILVDEPRSYQDALNIYLKEGKNFPAARILGIKILSQCWIFRRCLADRAAYQPLIHTKYILGIEYLKALKTCGSQITPYPILREGAPDIMTPIFS